MIDIVQYQKAPVEHYSNCTSDNPTVSVIVSAYNHEKYIEKCLEGILMQKTQFDYEILIGEDDSTDSTREICINYAIKYPEKIKLLLHHRSNVIQIAGKPTGRFNFLYGLSKAKGKYIALCEGDDYWIDPEKIQKQVTFLDSNVDVVLSFHDSKIVDENNNILKNTRFSYPIKEKTKNDLMTGCFIPTQTIMFRNLISDIPVQFLKSVNGDMMLYAILGHYGHAVRQFNIEKSAYRIHSNGLWSKKSMLYRIEQSIQSLSLIKDLAPSDLITDIEKKIQMEKRRLLIIPLFSFDLRAYFVQLITYCRNNKYSVFALINHFKDVFYHVKASFLKRKIS